MTSSSPLNTSHSIGPAAQETRRSYKIPVDFIPVDVLEKGVFWFSLVCIFNLPFSEAFKEISLVGGFVLSLLMLQGKGQFVPFFSRLLPGVWPGFVFLGVSFASGIHSINTFEGLRGAWGDLEALMGLLLFATLLNIDPGSVKIRRWMLGMLIAGTFSGASVGFWRIWQEHRPFLGMMNLGDKNSTAQFLSILFLIVFFFHAQKDRWGIPSWLFVSLYPVLACLLFMTHSRTFLIAVPTALFVMIVVLKWWRTLTVVVGFLFCLFLGTLFSPTLKWEALTVIHPSSDGSFQSRYPTWQGAIRMWKDHPFLGVGPDNFHMPNIHKLYHLPDYASHGHNMFFNLLGEYGSLGVIAFFLWIVVWLRTVVSGVVSKSLPKSSLALCLGTLFIFLVGGVAHPMWGGSTSLLFVLILGLSLFPCSIHEKSVPVAGGGEI
ncbi:MAG: O-antigen ligase family protein [Leptospirales bacterium]